MVSKGQFVGLDWNRITRLHSQVMTGTQEVKNSLTASRCHLKAYPRYALLKQARLNNIHVTFNISASGASGNFSVRATLKDMATYLKP